eukprot:snap_masked-scaffold314_size210232-processed-gene-1.0 protein:Tk09148 transcript:snap_masked-scaffold314_size210232-processed-gene-1.0-mRNA-1 annotation:"protein boule"
MPILAHLRVSTASMEPSPSPPSPSLSNHSSNVMMSSSHLISTNSVVGGITSVPNNSVAITNQTNNAISNGTSIKYGTLVPNRIFVGGISSTTTEADLHKLFSAFGNVKATKIISDRGGCSKGYGFVTFETEEEAKKLQAEADNIILKERKLNIAPAIKKQNGMALFQDGMGGAGNPNTSSPSSAAAAALAVANSQIPPAAAFMIPHAMAAASQQQAAAAAMFLPAANSAAAAAAAQQFNTYQQQAVAAAALQQQQISGVAAQPFSSQKAANDIFLGLEQDFNESCKFILLREYLQYFQERSTPPKEQSLLLYFDPARHLEIGRHCEEMLAEIERQPFSIHKKETSSCSTTNSTSISGATNGNTPWRWVSQASSNGHANGVGGHGASSPVTHHQQMAFQQSLRVFQVASELVPKNPRIAVPKLTKPASKKNSQPTEEEERGSTGDDQVKQNLLDRLFIMDDPHLMDPLGYAHPSNGALSILLLVGLKNNEPNASLWDSLHFSALRSQAYDWTLNLAGERFIKIAADLGVNVVNTIYKANNASKTHGTTDYLPRGSSNGTGTALGNHAAAAGTGNQHTSAAAAAAAAAAATYIPLDAAFHYFPTAAVSGLPNAAAAHSFTDPTLYSNPPATPAMSYTMAPDGMWYSYPPPTGGVGFVNTPTWDSKDMGYVSMESPFNFSHDSQHPPYEMASDTPKAITQDILDQHGGSSVSVPVMTSPGFNVAPPPLVYSYPPNYNQGMPMGGSPQSWNMGVGNRDGTYSVPWNGPMYPQDPPPPLPGHIQHTKSDLKGGLAKLDGRKLSYELQSGVRNGPKKMDGQRHNNYNKHSVSSSEGAPGGNPSWFDPHNSSRPPPSVSRPFRGGFTKPPGSLFPRGGSLLGKPLQFEGIQGRSRWFGNPNGGRKPNLNTFKRHEPPRRGMPNKDLADQNVGVCHVCPAHSPAKRGCKGSGTVGRTGGFGPNGKNTKNVAKTSTEAKNKTDGRVRGSGRVQYVAPTPTPKQSGADSETPGADSQQGHVHEPDTSSELFEIVH